jgi:hypothetical protein
MTIKLFDRAKLPSRISSDNEIKQEIQLTKVNSNRKNDRMFLDARQVSRWIWAQAMAFC